MVKQTEDILIVEDDAGVAQLQRRRLERAGFRTFAATNIDTALALVAENSINLVVADFHLLGGATGLDLVERLKSAGHDLPVIMVTGFSDEETAIRALRAGVRDFVTKSTAYLDYLPDAVGRVLQQTRLEEALRKSEERFRVLTDVSPQFVWESDAAGSTTYCNQRWYDYTGLTEAASAGDGWISAVHPDCRGHAMAGWSEAMSRRSEYEIELPFRRASDGEYRWHLVRSVPVKDEIGNVQKWIGVASDIHDRRLAEQSLRESDERFQAFMDNSPAIAFVKDADGKMIYANATLEKRFALERKDWFGKRDDDLWPADVAQKLRKNDLAALVEGRGIEYLEEVPSPNGASYWSVYKFPIRNASGQVELGGMAVDLTERRRAEAALLEKEAQLHQAQKLEAVGQLAGGVAHEYNNLLQAILGYTSFALDSLPPDHAACGDLRQVEKAAERAGTLTRQLLGFSRRQPLRRSDLNPNEQVADLLKMLRPLLGADIELRTDLAEDVGAVHADAALLQQMLLNLCVNARDAMPAGGRLTIQTKNVTLSTEYCEANVTIKPGRYVLFTVSDTGCGMTPEVKARIFEPFFTTKEVGKGTGLGLAMVYGIASQHGGAVHVYSEYGHGTTFRIHLPRLGDSQPEPAEAPRGAITGGHETILVADDEPFVRDIAVRTLRRAGYRVLEAQDGHEAVRVFEEHANVIELALLDVVMPKAGGDVVYRHICEHRPGTAVIFCSGYDPDATRTEFIAHERMTLLQKPFDPRLLLTSVRDALDARVAVDEVSPLPLR